MREKIIDSAKQDNFFIQGQFAKQGFYPFVDFGLGGLHTLGSSSRLKHHCNYADHAQFAKSLQSFLHAVHLDSPGSNPTYADPETSGSTLYHLCSLQTALRIGSSGGSADNQLGRDGKFQRIIPKSLQPLQQYSRRGFSHIPQRLPNRR